MKKINDATFERIFNSGILGYPMVSCTTGHLKIRGLRQRSRRLTKYQGTISKMCYAHVFSGLQVRRAVSYIQITNIFLFKFRSLSRSFHSYRDEPIRRWGEKIVPQENHLAHPQAELGLSYM